MLELFYLEDYNVNIRKQLTVFLSVLFAGLVIASVNFSGCAASKPKELTTEQKKALQDSLFNEHKKQLRLWNSLAYEPFRQRDYEQAKKYYRRIAEADTSGIYSNTVYRNLGTCYIQLGEPDSAEWAYKLGIERNPDDPYSHKLLAYIYRIQGRTDEAIREYQTLISLEPDSVGYYRHLGELYVRNDEIDKAIESYQKAVQLDPSEKDTQQILNNLLSQTNNLDALIAQRESMVESFPEDMNFRVDLARSYFDIGEFRKAIDQLKVILEKDSENIFTLEMLGESYKQMDRFREALDIYRDILSLRPDDKKNRCNLAMTYMELGEYATARSEVLKVLRTDPDYGLAFLTYGMIYERSANRCVDAGDGKVTFDDKLVYKMAYDQYAKAKNDPEWRSDAERRMNYLEGQIPTTGDYFMNKNVTMPRKPCYSWIQ